MHQSRSQKALILGASSGIGFQCAKYFYKKGYDICVISRSKDNLLNAVKKIGSNNSNTLDYFVADLSNSDSVNSLISYLDKGYNFDFSKVILNSGGPAYYNNSLQIDEEEWLLSFNSLFLSQIKILNKLLPKMKENNFGRVVSIGSSGIITPIEGLTISNTIRSAMYAWIKSVSNELGKYNITLNTVIPGKIDTSRLNNIEKKTSESLGQDLSEYKKIMAKKIPMQRYGHVDDMVKSISYLLSDENTYITGSSIRVDGGLINVI